MSKFLSQHTCGLLAACILTLSCKGSSKVSSDDKPLAFVPGTYSIGGTISGLSGTVVLQNNGSDDLTITNNGSFTFATALGDGEIYDVTVLSNPAGQICHIRDNQGTVMAANITSIVVQCSSSDFTWVQDAYLKASNAEAGDWFGHSVAVSGSTIVVGAYYEDSNQTAINNTDGAAAAHNGADASGAVYVFKAF